ncbi:MAG: hypothetical protein CVT63_05070 [Candidatus Anoxymicrobium japonicum]|uniref:PpiC domain-containing protein n=1 Tax=Candidatus Anoxymicrobium japonicum TaxID=2013648 RepID=A0A2N3G5M1_9ACTN|nr:MAG: hypothetical protein CVT63_05070 [Candidatus Anoxymicrobium japonicum]
MPDSLFTLFKAGVALALSVLLLALAGCSGSAITVNGNGIERARFQREVNRRLSMVQKDDPGELKGSRGEKLKASTKREVATEMIKRVLVDAQARKLGVALPVDAVNRKVEDEQRKVGSDRFFSDLGKQKLTLEDYKRKVKGELLVDALGQKVCAEVIVSRDDAESFYLTHKRLFTRNVMVHVAHILLDTQGEADAVAADARRGEDFSRIAKQVSKDNATRVNGGDLGWIEKGTMDPMFEKAAFSLKSGEVSGVVQASDGFHVIKTLERREASTPPFSEVVPEAMKMLDSRKKEEIFSDFLRTIYANAIVEADGVGKWDPRIGMVVER